MQAFHLKSVSSFWHTASAKGFSYTTRIFLWNTALSSFKILIKQVSFYRVDRRSFDCSADHYVCFCHALLSTTSLPCILEHTQTVYTYLHITAASWKCTISPRPTFPMVLYWTCNYVYCRFCHQYEEEQDWNRCTEGPFVTFRSVLQADMLPKSVECHCSTVGSVLKDDFIIVSTLMKADFNLSCPYWGPIMLLPVGFNSYFITFMSVM